MQNSILIVDDDQRFSSELTKFLETDFSISVADSPSQAMAHISRVRPILMLLDFDLPDMNGLEFLKLAKRRFIDLPIIMLTGQNDSETAIEDPPVIIKILSHLGLPTRTPPRAPAPSAGRGSVGPDE